MNLKYWAVRIIGNIIAVFALHLMAFLLDFVYSWKVWAAAFIFYVILTITDATCMGILKTQHRRAHRMRGYDEG